MDFLLVIENGKNSAKYSKIVEKLAERISSLRINKLKVKRISSIGGIFAREPGEGIFIIDVSRKAKRVTITERIEEILESILYEDPFNIGFILMNARNSGRLSSIRIIRIPEHYNIKKLFSETELLLRKTVNK
ncbi:MAG: hypothetical protein NTV63_02980 [Candidatus Woesearchaeota archaeon]|nr:hypothetical protein [Candidatus Woesearchaeota archaeon]